MAALAAAAQFSAYLFSWIHCTIVTITWLPCCLPPLSLLTQVVADAKKEGKYDATGIIKPGCESIEFR